MRYLKKGHTQANRPWTGGQTNRTQTKLITNDPVVIKPGSKLGNHVFPKIFKNGPTDRVMDGQSRNKLTPVIAIDTSGEKGF